MQWLRFLRRLPEYADGREIHLVMDSYSAPRCAAVKAVAEELRIKVHFIPPGLTDLLQPLDRSEFGALKAEYRAIYRNEMSERQDERVSKADFAAFAVLAWELVWEEAIHHGWDCYTPDGAILAEELDGEGE
jgi:hypothetical protein